MAKEKSKSDKKSKNKKLQEKLFPKKKSAWLHYNDAEHKKIMEFSEGYKRFMAKNKTERLCAEFIIKSLEKAGFKDISKQKAIKKGDKIYKNVKGKAVIGCVAGNSMETFQLIGSHMDSPRLDLKPNPLLQDAEMAMLKSHYYGGIKKYQWVNTPLALHGIVMTKDGKKIEVHIGEKDDEPRFIIPDLAPHLASEQMKKEARKIVEGEELNIIFGHMPINDKDIEEKVKFRVMKYLNDKYGMTAEDFICADLEFVPAVKPIDIGLDLGLIGAYGHDDKACVYTSLMALTEVKSPKRTAVGIFVDKEEIGSTGDTGAKSNIILNFARDYAKKAGLDINPTELLEYSKAVSGDTTAAMDPNFPSVHDSQNVNYVGKGISIEKFGGAGGKYYTAEAHAEYMQYLRKLCEDNKIPWQTGELGKIDLGGGGTIGMYIAEYGMDVVDAGPCVLGVHSPCEVLSKVDLYACYQFYRAFFGS